MNLILPTEGVDLDELIEDFDGESWQAMMSHRAEAKVTLSMPRFKIESNLDLANVLSAMGMPLAFSSKNADFSAMLDYIQTFFVSNVIQKSYISVDEKGAEAAAVTLIALDLAFHRPNPLIVNMVLDRPFVFAITEQSTGAILFMGKVTTL
jgi:serpin B